MRRDDNFSGPRVDQRNQQGDRHVRAAPSGCHQGEGGDCEALKTTTKPFFYSSFDYLYVRKKAKKSKKISAPRSRSNPAAAIVDQTLYVQEKILGGAEKKTLGF